MNRGMQAYVVILYLFVQIESIYNTSVIKKEQYFFCNFKKIHYYNLKLGVFAKTNPQLDFNPKPILKLESNAKLT